jgi:GT2 family glycosyltransferase
MKVAIVILNWNGAKLLQQFLPSILRYSPEVTVFVADNASSDDSITVLKTQFPSVQIIQNQDNYGFAKGYNEALKNLNFDIYALVNSDIEVTENWLQPILEKFKNEPKTVIIQPKILDFKNKAFFEYAGAAGGYIDKYGYPFCRGRIFDTIEKDHQQYEDETEIFWASGACFFIRSEVYHALQGFDDDFFAHQEEIDLCWRAINRGHHIQYTPKSVVYHVGGATLQKGNPKKTYLNFRNSLLMLVKNLPKSQLLPVLFLRLCFDGLAGIQFLLKGNPKHTLAILKAHFIFYSMLPRFYKKRESNQIATYFKTKSVVYFYYIKKQTIFAKNF